MKNQVSTKSKRQTVSPAPRRGRPRSDGRAPITRDAILEAAWRKLADASVAGTSVKDIADELGCHTASIFHHFPTKQAIIVAVALQAFTRELNWFRKIEALGAAPDATLFRIVHDDVFTVGSGSSQVRSVFLAPELRNDGCPELEELMQSYHGRLVDLIAQGTKARLFVEVDATYAADCLNSLGMVAAVKWGATSSAILHALALTAARIAIGGLLTDPARLPEVERDAMAIRVKREQLTV